MGYRAGEDVFVESKPFSYVVDPQFCKNVCDSCLKEGNGLFACAKCHKVYYCNRSCQKNAWKSHHEVECGYLQIIPEYFKLLPEYMTEVLFVLRIVLKLSQNGKDEFVTLPNGKKRYFADLMSHKDKLEENMEKMQYLKSIFKEFQVWLGDKAPSFDEFLEIYGKINTNRMESGLYLGFSAIDHSCAPNAAFCRNGIELTIRARDNIEDFSGTLNLILLRISDFFWLACVSMI